MNEENRLKNILLSENSEIKDALVSLEKSGQKICFIVSTSEKMVGTLSDGDIRKGLLKGFTLKTKVVDVMNKNFVWVDKSESRMNVLDLMKSRKINVIPILEKDKRIVGIHTLYGILGSEAKSNTAVIMAGGKGERLKPLTDNLPKPMITVAGKPILERIIHHLVGYGITDIVISVNYLKEKIIDYFGDGKKYGCKIEYLKEEKPLGTAGSLSLLQLKNKEPLIILNGDIITQVDISDMLQFHTDNNFHITAGVYDYIHQIPFGVVNVKNLKIKAIEEKPVVSWLVASGIYVISPQVVSLIPKNQFFTMPDLIKKALKQNKSVGAFRIEEEWMDIGRKGELSRARGSFIE
ncbi:MAG: nucleotidyltransferase family protein [Acidobacteriota bacterium]